ncbi:protein ABHD13 [Amyelois transitella]|uniref:protein ABHD13 n=1 Tax=Amyelois transitella TaxID=680683 RepID=UPI00067D1CAC|nr:protein ABHD13 [Amyelois transitella]
MAHIEVLYHILRVVLYKLWVVTTLTLFSCLLIYWFYGFFTAITIFICGISGILYSAQDLLLYYPNDPPDSRAFVLQPSNYKLPYESIKIINRDGFKIHMFLIKQPNNSNHRPTMLFFHGNAGNMGQRLSNASGFYHKLNINILMLEYRGYGLSEGSPSEKGLYSDAQCAMDYILQRSDVDTSKIILFGRSLGGAIAIDLASRVEYRSRIWAMIVENTFTSIPEMARIILKWRCLLYLPEFCHKNKYLSIKKINQVLTPSLFICGSNDALVPPSMAKELYVKCGAMCKKLVVMPGGGHDDTWTCRDYYNSIEQFLANVPSLPDNVGPYFDHMSKDPANRHTLVHTV